MIPLILRTVNVASAVRFAMSLVLCGLIVAASTTYGADGAATKAISGGSMHSVVLRNDGTVWAFGHNEFGECGSGSMGVSSSITNPVCLSSSISNIVSVSAGGWDAPYSAHTLVLRNDGFVYSSGNNKFGQLGDGTVSNRASFVLVTNLYNIIAVSAGGYHSLALRGDGTVWGWGANASGQTGNGSPSTSQLTPVQVGGLTNIVAVAAGLHHSLALNANGTVWGWGADNEGQIGDGSVTSKQKVPVMIGNLTNIVAIAAAGNHSMALKSDGTVWCWGRNSEMECGIGNTVSPQKKPVQVANVSDVVAIEAGGLYCVALEADGSQWGWGSTTSRQILGTYFQAYNSGTIVSGSKIAGPTKFPSGVEGLGIGAGEYHSLCLTIDGRILGWGADDYGQVGPQVDLMGANMKVGLAFVDISGIAVAMKGHDLEAAADGSLWSVGYNGFGQLGDGTTVNREGLEYVSGQSSVTEASAGGGHSLALESNGSVSAWGNNIFGQLGEGTTINHLSPVPANLTGAAAIASGFQHSVALLTNGTVLTWGANQFGQLGDSTFTNRLAPVLATNLSNVASIAAGWDHSIALLSNHTVVAWGGNASGQIGDRTLTNHYGYTNVFGLANVTSIAAGGQHSLALSNGVVWSWGNNLYGQLGDGTTINRAAPVHVASLPPNIEAVAAGDYFSVALSSNGVVWFWGDSLYGQAGYAGITNPSLPLQLSNLAPAQAIEAAGNVLRITMADGSVQSLGANGCGQLGNGSTGNSSAFAIDPQHDSIQFDYTWLTTNQPSIAVGNGTVYILRADGTLWSESFPPR